MSLPDLIIVGASARAAAGSARRAGLRPWCVDLFADTDLAAGAAVWRLEPREYPAGFVEIVRKEAPPAPLLYTGGLENYPEVYRALARLRPVWGYVHPDPFHGDSVRNPQFLQQLCADHGIARPEIMLDPTQAPRTGEWLLKPRSGSGGRGIAVWTGPALESAGCYSQRYVPGMSLSAVYSARAGGATLLGVTQQLIGAAAFHAPTPYSYVGNVTIRDDAVDPELTASFVTLGQVLARADPYLQGLFGIDVVVAGKTLHLIEVNPRYTASVEVIEYATRRALLADHARAFLPSDQLAAMPPGRALPAGLGIGKAVYYAAHDLVFTAPPDLTMVEDPWVMPRYADVPLTGELIRQGHPVLTILTQEPDPLAALRRRAAALDDHYRQVRS